MSQQPRNMQTWELVQEAAPEGTTWHGPSSEQAHIAAVTQDETHIPRPDQLVYDIEGRSELTPTELDNLLTELTAFRDRYRPENMVPVFIPQEAA